MVILFNKYFFFYYIMNCRGQHILCDFIFDSSNIDDMDLAMFIFMLMERSIRRTTMRIVHSKLVILGDTDTSEAGFTSVVLIDESHITSHCYFKQGLLALDIFTCGQTRTEDVMDYIVNEITQAYPSFRCIYNKKHDRFHF